MSDDRIADLERRLRALEDERDIARVIASYGPLVDSGDAEGAAARVAIVHRTARQLDGTAAGHGYRRARKCDGPLSSVVSNYLVAGGSRGIGLELVRLLEPQPPGSTSGPAR